MITKKNNKATQHFFFIFANVTSMCEKWQEKMYSMDCLWLIISSQILVIHSERIQGKRTDSSNLFFFQILVLLIVQDFVLLQLVESLRLLKNLIILSV